MMNSVSDLISRQDAINAIENAFDRETILNRFVRKIAISAVKLLPSAQPKQRWIPCSDVPDTNRNVFIARGEQAIMTVCIGHYNHDYKQWYDDRNGSAKGVYDGLYWCEMPSLPEPWRE